MKVCLKKSKARRDVDLRSVKAGEGKGREGKAGKIFSEILVYFFGLVVVRGGLDGAGLVWGIVKVHAFFGMESRIAHFFWFRISGWLD